MAAPKSAAPTSWFCQHGGRCVRLSRNPSSRLEGQSACSTLNGCPLPREPGCRVTGDAESGLRAAGCTLSAAPAGLALPHHPTTTPPHPWRPAMACRFLSRPAVLALLLAAVVAPMLVPRSLASVAKFSSFSVAMVLGLAAAISGLAAAALVEGRVADDVRLLPDAATMGGGTPLGILTSVLTVVSGELAGSCGGPAAQASCSSLTSGSPDDQPSMGKWGGCRSSELWASVGPLQLGHLPAMQVD